MARVAQTGLTLSLDEAKASLLDNKGNLLQFEEQENGTFKSEAIEGDGFNYIYELNPQTTIVTVSVTKESKEEAKGKDKKKSGQTAASAAAATTAAAKQTEAVIGKPRAATGREEKEADEYNKLKNK